MCCRVTFKVPVHHHGIHAQQTLRIVHIDCALFLRNTSPGFSSYELVSGEIVSVLAFRHKKNTVKLSFTSRAVPFVME